MKRVYRALERRPLLLPANYHVECRALAEGPQASVAFRGHDSHRNPDPSTVPQALRATEDSQSAKVVLGGRTHPCDARMLGWERMDR